MKKTFELADFDFAQSGLALAVEETGKIARETRQYLTEHLPPSQVRKARLQLIDVVEQQNNELRDDIDQHFGLARATLKKSTFTTGAILDSNFSKKVDDFEKQAQLVRLRLTSYTRQPEPDELEVFQLGDILFVSHFSALDILGEFDSIDQVNAFAKSRRRKEKINKLLGKL
ncbi:hypothetical protein [Hymenobacter pini]|uniref:hypothetical protein n=1 Tax=Hymenobacter pini TaxID=2880879 RepID=UPI001CF308E7|nr:hypothetical protein [Hymenobacter pini]MCA8831907.1 hypothetical protein [Hymenobacter pini]